MKKNTTKPKKRNPPDSTFRNINALKKRVKELEEAVRRLEQTLHYLESKEIMRNATEVWVGEIECKARPHGVIEGKK